MKLNNKKYKWCTSYNNGQGAWIFHWKDGNEEWKINQGKNPSGRFSNLTTNAVIYCSYLMTTSEEPMEEEAKGGDDIQNNDFISLIALRDQAYYVPGLPKDLRIISRYQRSDNSHHDPQRQEVQVVHFLQQC